MDRLFRLTCDLRYVTWERTSMEFVVTEQVRTASRRPVCTLQIGEHLQMDDLALVQQIIEDCILSACGRTVGTQQELEL